MLNTVWGFSSPLNTIIPSEEISLQKPQRGILRFFVGDERMMQNIGMIAHDV